jgi:hypothetical protein
MLMVGQDWKVESRDWQILLSTWWFRFKVGVAAGDGSHFDRLITEVSRARLDVGAGWRLCVGIDAVLRESCVVAWDG